MVLVLLVVFALGGAMFGAGRKIGGWGGLVAGLLLGPIGWAIAALSPPADPPDGSSF